MTQTLHSFILIAFLNYLAAQNEFLCVAPGLNCVRKTVLPAPWKLVQIGGLSDTGDAKLFTGEQEYTSHEEEVYFNALRELVFGSLCLVLQLCLTVVNYSLGGEV